MLKITDIKVGDKFVFLGDKHGDLSAFVDIRKGDILEVTDVDLCLGDSILAYSSRINEDTIVYLDEIELIDDTVLESVNETMISCGEIEDLF